MAGFFMLKVYVGAGRFFRWLFSPIGHIGLKTLFLAKKILNNKIRSL